MTAATPVVLAASAPAGCSCAGGGEGRATGIRVALAAGLIVLAGALGAALIGASPEGDRPSTDGWSRGEVRVVVDSAKATVRENALVVAVRGTAHNLEEGDAVYAVLESGVHQEDASITNGRRWFASDAMVPTPSGTWSTVINAPSEVATDFTVFAVQAKGCPPGDRCGTRLPSRQELENGGGETPRLGVRSRLLPRVTSPPP